MDNKYFYETTQKIFSSNMFKEGIIIEVGSERGGGSTKILAELALKFKLGFITIDIMPEISKNAQIILKNISSNFISFNIKAEDFFRSYMSDNILLIYMDAFDIYFEGQEIIPERNEKYKSMGLELTNENAWKMHLECCKYFYNKIYKGGYVIFDDTWKNKNGELEGKGKLAIPFLLQNDYIVDVEHNENGWILKRK